MLGRKKKNKATSEQPEKIELEEIEEPMEAELVEDDEPIEAELVEDDEPLEAELVEDDEPIEAELVEEPAEPVEDEAPSEVAADVDAAQSDAEQPVADEEPPIDEPIAETLPDGSPIFYQSEIIEDDDEVVELEAIEDEEPETPAADEAAEDTAEKQEQEPEPEPTEKLLYEVEPFDDVEEFKPAKLQMLPNLVDYMIGLNLSKQMKLVVGVMLVSAYGKFKNTPAEVDIIKRCIKKLTRALYKDVQSQAS